MLPAFAQPQVGIVGPIITYYDRPDLVWSAGGAYSRLLGYTPNPQMDRPLEQVRALGDRDAGYINGCALMARREVFDAIGDLWDDYFLYFEEADFCLRAIHAGFRCRVVAQPLVRHKVSSSGGVAGSNAFTPAKAYYFGRNPFLMLRRNARGFWAFTGYVSQFLVVFPYQLWHALRNGNPGVMRHYVQGMWHGMLGRVGVRP
jgi:GT2 family glycosyltransferase